MTFVLNDPCQESPEIHVGDIGTEFIITIFNQQSEIQNLSFDVVSLTINFKTPSREVKTKDAELYTDGTDGRIMYVLEDGDMDEAGLWSYQCVIEFVSGIWYTNVEKFTVYPNIS